MYRLRAGRIKIPRLYVAESSLDCSVCKTNGIPFVYKTKGMTDKQIIGSLLLPTLRKMFPDIKWHKVLGLSIYENIYVQTPPCDSCGTSASGDAGKDSEVADYADDERVFDSGVESDWGERPLDKYLGDVSSEVNIETLQELNLLPAFMDEIATNIARNIYGSSVWSEGYTKKLGACLGNYNQAYEKRNLIILDISGSIPRGVSSTMLVLVPTLRERCNADLIVTGSKSLWIPGEEEVNPQEIRNRVGYGNESIDFLKILNEHVFGKAWGNVIVFGDEDRPVKLLPTEDYIGTQYDTYDVTKYKLIDKLDWSGTSVEHLWSYHTRNNRTCGYGKWVEELFEYKVPSTTNTEWCSIMEKRW